MKYVFHNNQHSEKSRDVSLIDVVLNLRQTQLFKIPIVMKAYTINTSSASANTATSLQTKSISKVLKACYLRIAFPNKDSPNILNQRQTSKYLFLFRSMVKY